jgi:hypothetical protein
MTLPGRVERRNGLDILARRLMFAGIALALAACIADVSPSPSATLPPVRVYNQTSVAITLVVNGSTVAVIPAEGLADPVASPLSARPWAIQLESPSGRSLVTLNVPSADITVGLYGTPGNLACGMIFLAVAGPLPISEPAFSPIPGATPCD